MADFTMPALGADMETGKVVQWHVKAGDRVRPGDVVAVVETHKGAIDVECFLDGVIDDLAPLGTELPVGAVLARVRTEGESSAAPAATPAPAPVPASPASQAASAAPARVRMTPAARRRAQALGVERAAVSATGPDGAITLLDVERAAAAKIAAAGATPVAARRGFEAAQMRQAIAVAMARSKREIPHYYLSRAIDFGVAAAWLADWNAAHDPTERLLPAALLLKATALALGAVPQLNGFFENGSFRPGTGIHVGWAVALRGGGLIAPAVHDADRLALPALMATLRDLVQRARGGGLRSSELTDPTVTVTSLGERGADSVLGVIVPPQVAIVGFGRIAERPWVVDGTVVARPLVHATLAADHRASDGHVGGLLLAAIDDALQAPERL